MATKSDKQDFKKKISALVLGDVVGVFLRTLKLLFNSVAVLVFLFGLFGAGIGIGFVVSLFDDVKIPKTEELVAKVSEVSRISTVTYSDGSLVSEVNSDLLRVPITSEEVSNYLKQAVIATEDETFETHNGVVPKAVLRAALGSVGLGSSSGGSTLTQQLIKQQLVGDAPTFTRKANEIVSALALERNMTKEEILTIYLNVSPFGRNNQGRNIAGVEAAAQGIFGKPAKDLTVPQAAFIAGLPQSPIVYSPYASDGTRKSDEDMVYGVERYQDVLFNMYRASFLTKEEYETYKAYDIKQDFIAPAPVMADTKDYLYYKVMEEAQEVMFDYLVKRDKVSKNDLKNDETKASYEELAKQELSQGGYTIKSTVDQGIYAAMQSVVANYGSVLDDGNEYVETGSVLIDNATGAILGFVGGRDYSTNQNNHAFDTLRSPASTIKPLLAYGIAIDQGLIGSASILSDYPTNFSSGQPIMYGSGRGTGMMNLQTAIDRSVNIPAFWTYKMMRNAGVDAKAYMDKMYVWTGYHNNSQYVAHMVDALYNVNADMFAGKFELDSSVIASSVVASTGQRAGTTQVNGRQVTVGGAMTTSYWAKNGAPVTSYNFMVGGTDSDRAQAWNTIIGSQTPTSSSSTQRSSSTRSSTSSSANNTNQSSETQTATSEQANNDSP
ncbi:TPA: penicillin-binding protein [Streptococcus suis]|nr:penicillin-binding protein [Streptococcus suis]